MTILSSRSHTCVHPQISQLSNKDEACRNLNKKGQNILEMNNDVEYLNYNKVCNWNLFVYFLACKLIFIFKLKIKNSDPKDKQQSGCSFKSKINQLKSKDKYNYKNFGFEESVWDIEELMTTLKSKKV